MTRDPNSYIQASADALAETLLSKNSDYAPDGEFSNFERSARVAGISPLQLIAAQIAIKMTRIESLMATPAQKPTGEALKDSFLDLAGYATIGHAWLESHEPEVQREFDYAPMDGRSPSKPLSSFIEDREEIRNSMADPHRHIWVSVNDSDSECTRCPAVRHG